MEGERGDLRPLARSGEIVPARDLPLIAAAVIDDLGSPDVVCAVQAMLWQFSSRLIHRAKGWAWANANPSQWGEFKKESAMEGFDVIIQGYSPHQMTEKIMAGVVQQERDG